MSALWLVFASLAVGGALGMVLGRNPVASLMFLVLTLFSLAVLYLMLGAHFIAAVQIIIYAGAIMVLFLFVIMLLNLGHDYRADFRGVAWTAAAFVVSALLVYMLISTFGSDQSLVLRGPGVPTEVAWQQSNAVAAIAYPLLNDYVVAFELVSVLLLVAIIGAILLAKRRV